MTTDRVKRERSALAFKDVSKKGTMSTAKVTRGYLLVLACVLAAGVGTISSGWAQLCSALAIVCVGVWIFVEHGGARITAAGLYGLAMAIFAGGVSVYWWALNAGGYRGDLAVVTWVALATLCAQYILFWFDEGQVRVAAPRVNSATLQGGVILASSMVILSVLLLPLLGERGLHPSAGVMAFMMTLLLVTRGGHVSRIMRLAGAVGLLLLFYQLAFTGSGRLVLVTLALTGAVVYSIRMKTRLIKWCLVAGIIPALSFLIALREGRTKETGQSMDGVGSVVNPFTDLDRLYRYGEADGFMFGYGETFFASFMFWVPRPMWPDKPAGFGSVLTEILHPDLLAVGHSMAALSLGEWYYNFGVLGWVLMVPGLGWFIKFVDRRFMVLLAEGYIGKLSSTLRLAIWSTLIAETPTLVWVGTFTYVSRAGQRSAMLLMLMTVLLFIGVLTTRQLPRQSAKARRTGSHAQVRQTSQA